MYIPEEFYNQRIGRGYRVLGLDLDGVCADYTGGLRTFMAENGYPDAMEYPEPDQYNLARATGWPFKSIDEYVKVHRAAVEAHLYRDLPVIDGASDTLWQLSDLHVHIRIVTHRLFIGGVHEIVVADTSHWLEKNKIPYMSLCFTGLKDSVGANVYMEDSPSAIASMREDGQPYVIFDQRYNRDQEGPRITQWKDSADQILSVLEGRDGHAATSGRS